MNVKSHLVADLVGDRPADGLGVVDLDGVAVVMVMVMVMVMLMVMVNMAYMSPRYQDIVYGQVLIMRIW